MANDLASAIEASFWLRLRYNVFGRVLPAFLFAYLAWQQAGHLQAAIASYQGDMLAALGIMRGALYLVFTAFPAAIYVWRPLPKARDGRLLPRAAGFTGTVLLLFVGAYLPTGPVLWTAPAWVSWPQTLLLLAATALAVWALLILRRNLSLIPEARKLVTGGPYRWVRHPMYLAEIAAAGSLLIYQPHLVPFVAWLVFVAVQLTRANYEEALLTGFFPEYAAFKAGRRRIIPFIW